MAFDKKILRSKPVLFILGMIFMIVGIALVLVWWKDVTVLFRGCIGVFTALAGLVILSMMRD